MSYGQVSSEGPVFLTQTLTQLTTPGLSEKIVTKGMNLHVFQVDVVLGGDSPNVVVGIQASNDGTNFREVNVDAGLVVTGFTVVGELVTISITGIYIIKVSEVVANEMKFSFVSEADTGNTIDVKYLGSE